jgi:hypothetical protein
MCSQPHPLSILHLQLGWDFGIWERRHVVCDAMSDRGL